jgi:hypothetical protein
MGETCDGAYQDPPDPNASCFDFTSSGGLSCLCAATEPGTTYTFLVDSYYFTLQPNVCTNTVVTINKKVSCDEGGVIPGGACCDLIAGTCTDGIDEVECRDSVTDSNHYAWTNNKTCDLVECLPINGACCDTSPGNGGSCNQTIAADCPVDGNYITWTALTDCGDLNDGEGCQEVTGACCDALDGICTTGLQEFCTCADCTWTEGADCPGGANPITCNPAMGACCDTGYQGDPTQSHCEQTTRVGCNCEKCTAESWHRGMQCGEIDCIPNFVTIPTVSEWGLAVLALLLLIGGKIYFSRRDAATA